MLTERREVYAPFEYPMAYEYWLRQEQAHWLHSEVAMGGDVSDWKTVLTESEQRVVGSVLKGFTQTEVVVNEYWSRRVGRWFPKPEVCMMASAFANMETVHTKAYAYLNESLGLDDFAAFLDDPAAAAKIQHLVNTEGETDRDIARSLAVFSGFAEGVQLFSSFAILMNFARHNKLKGVGQIVAFSVKDESLHSEAGCWLFREFMAERPDLWDDELKTDVYDAARSAVALEDTFLAQVFELGEVEGFTQTDLKAFIRARANAKLADLGLKSNWRNIDAEALDHMEWFNMLTSGQEHQDFFSGRVTGYSKGVVDLSRMYDDIRPFE